MNFMNNKMNQKYLRWSKQEGWDGWDASVESRSKNLAES